MFFNTVNWNNIDIYWKKLSIAHHIPGEIHFLCLLWDEHVNLIKCCPEEAQSKLAVKLLLERLLEAEFQK